MEKQQTKRYKTFRKWKLKQDEIAEFAKKILETPFDIVDRQPHYDEVVFPNQMWVWKTQTTIHVVSRCIFSTDMDEYQLNDRGQDKVDVNVATMYKFFKKHIDTTSFELEEIADEYNHLTATALMYKNDKYDGKTVEAYGYDMNKCYLAALKEPVPVTQEMETLKFVEDGEIGFNVNYNRKVIHKDRDGFQQTRFVLEKVNVGEFAEYVFPLTESPFRKYAELMENLIDEAKVKGDKEKECELKTSIVCSVGNLQNHNPFIRAAIVENANNKIKSLIDENTILCNTDSIVSLVKRDDIPISNKVGEFKLEHHCNITLNGFNYTWDDGSTALRGTNTKPVKWTYTVKNNKLYIKEN